MSGYQQRGLLALFDDLIKELLKHVEAIARADPVRAKPGSLALDRSATSVDSDDRPGNIARVRRGEESHDLGDFLDARGTLEQGCGPQPCGALRVRTFGVHGTRGDGVHSYAAGAELRSPGARQRRDGTLRRPVGRTTRKSDLTSHAADVDDAAFAPGHHSWRKRGDEEEWCADVTGEQGVKRVDVEVRSRAKHGESGVVDHDVDVADVFDQALEVDWIAKVSCDEACSTARSGNGIDGLGAARGVAAVDDDFGSVASQLKGDCAAKTGRRAGHECLLVLEVVVWCRGHVCSLRIKEQTGLSVVFAQQIRTIYLR
jgi:hypothetical protein